MRRPSWVLAGFFRASLLLLTFAGLVSCGGGGGEAGGAASTPEAAPVITEQPRASQSVAAGTSVSFRVVATGSPAPTYQWKKAGTAISGATSDTYAIVSAVVGDSGNYTVTVTNAVGQVESETAALSVTSAPVAPAITTQPQSITVTAGQTATFRVEATGTAVLTYQWRKNGSNIQGATSSSYTTPATTLSDTSAKFSVVVANSVGHATSSDATLTVNAAAGDYKVAFVSLGGSLTVEQSVVAGGHVAEPAVPTRAGYTFGGWYKTLRYDSAWNFATDVVHANTVIYPKWTRTNPETFLEAEKPQVVTYDAGQTFYYGLRLPWNYDKAYNATRTYPLYIALHSGGAAMSTPMPPNAYPCFVLSPKLPDNMGIRWSSEALAWFMTIIDKVQADYRIDTTRMFIGGFSQGGIGTYQVATALQAHNGQLFASIDRAAGGGNSTDHILPDAALAKTSVHLKIGLKDYAGTVTALRNAYKLIKNHPSTAGATEVTYNHTVTSGTTSYQATSWLIVKDGVERARLTEFPEMGHSSIYDSSRFPWFYNQCINH